MNNSMFHLLRILSAMATITLTFSAFFYFILPIISFIFEPALPYLATLFFVSLAYMVCFFIYSITRSRKEVSGYFYYVWERMKNSPLPLEVYPDFEMLQDEEVLVPMTACYLEEKTIRGHTCKNIRDVIVTNKRIAIGLFKAGLAPGYTLVTIIPAFSKEIFGADNYWHPESERMLGEEADHEAGRRVYTVTHGPKAVMLEGLRYFGFVKHNRKMIGISYGEDELGSYVVVRKNSEHYHEQRIYHSQAKKIHKIFSS